MHRKYLSSLVHNVRDRYYDIPGRGIDATAIAIAQSRVALYLEKILALVQDYSMETLPTSGLSKLDNWTLQH